MKHIKKYKSFDVPINEELIGNIVNFFKKMWEKAIKELQDLANDPTSIKNWITSNLLNPKDDTNIFSQIIKEFQKKETANDQDCLTLVDNIIDPETGSLGKQGIGMLLNSKSLQGDDMKSKRLMVDYIISSVRSKTISDSKIKFASGPLDGKVDPNKKIIDLKDTTHLPELKKILSSCGSDEKKKKEETLKWIEKSLIPTIQNYSKSIREEDIKESLSNQGIDIEKSFNYKEGDLVKYKMDGYEDNKNPEDQPEKIGTKKIEKVEGDQIVFKDKDGKEFRKNAKDIIEKSEISEQDKGKNAQNLSKKLATIKSDEEKMKKISNFVDFINNDLNKEKISEIEKIITNDQ